MSGSGPIFIGGTGRSGTTVLSRYLGNHRELVNVPFEARFLTDRDGLLDVFTALTENYSINQGRLALRALERLMKTSLADPLTTPYLGYNRYGTLPPATLRAATDRLLSDLSAGTFRGRDYSSTDRRATLRRWGRPLQTMVGRLSKPLLGRPLRLINYSYQHIEPAEEMFIPRYFADAAALGRRLGSFVDELFAELIRPPAKNWCEDTPANVLHMPFLRMLFPAARFINIVRHPLGVAHSMRKMPWAPDDPEGVADYLDNLYARLIDCHEWALAEFPGQYRAVRLEDLVTPGVVEDLLVFTGLDPAGFDGSIRFEEEKINHYRHRLSANERDLLSGRLSRFIDYFGYDQLTPQPDPQII